MKTKLLILLAAACLAGTATADTIFRTDGRCATGVVILERAPTGLYFADRRGMEWFIPWTLLSDYDRVRFGYVSPVGSSVAAANRRREMAAIASALNDPDGGRREGTLKVLRAMGYDVDPE